VRSWSENQSSPLDDLEEGVSGDVLTDYVVDLVAICIRAP